jgi:hypothetical protein
MWRKEKKIYDRMDERTHVQMNILNILDEKKRERQFKWRVNLPVNYLLLNVTNRLQRYLLFLNFAF